MSYYGDSYHVASYVQITSCNRSVLLTLFLYLKSNALSATHALSTLQTRSVVKMIVNLQYYICRVRRSIPRSIPSSAPADIGDSFSEYRMKIEHFKNMTQEFTLH